MRILLNFCLFVFLSFATISTIVMPTKAMAYTVPAMMDGGIVDIMQVKTGDWQVNGYGCAASNLKVTDQNGNAMTATFYAKANYFTWTFSSEGWPAGTYNVIVDSGNLDCSTVLTINISK